MQVGTYPTRNFAQTCYSCCNSQQGSMKLKSRCTVGRAFPPASACRHAARTISSSSTLRAKDAWRIVSEDPHHQSGFPADCLHHWIFTANPNSRVLTSTRWILRRFSIQPSAKSCVTAGQGRKFYLRTVIVTAAVYWGFGCELRLSTNPLP
jgi:hypothetical protein